MNIDDLINGPDPLLEEPSEEVELHKIKFNIELDGKQQKSLDNLIAVIKDIGDTEDGELRAEKNRDNYIKCIEILLEVKQNFLKGNMYMFMTSGFDALSEIPFFDPDSQQVVKVTMKDIEFTFEAKDDEPIPEEELKQMVEFISIEQELIKKNRENPTKEELNETAEFISKEKENRENIKNKKKLPTAEDIKAARARLEAKGFV